MVSAISIKGLEKTYATGTHALKGVDLEIREGDFLALLGPNGAGKTTLISIVSGLTNKSGGTVSVFGNNIDTKSEEAKSYIGVVPQEFNFGIFETPENIVVTQAGYYGIPKVAAKKSAEKYLTALGLWEKRNEQSMRLSGGMKRRLMIARALVHEPKILILDEPTAGVDIELRRGMWDFLRTLTSEGRTIILTTHYLEEAEQLAQHVAIINKGEIVKSGSLKNLLSSFHVQTFLIDANRDVKDEELEKLSPFSAKRIDNNTIEIELGQEQNFNEVVRAFEDLSLSIASLRNKTNRLEELFVRLTKTP
jgi:ABC-2 type transport system ATP-binding protein